MAGASPFRLWFCLFEIIGALPANNHFFHNLNFPYSWKSVIMCYSNSPYQYKVSTHLCPVKLSDLRSNYLEILCLEQMKIVQLSDHIYSNIIKYLRTKMD